MPNVELSGKRVDIKALQVAGKLGQNRRLSIKLHAPVCRFNDWLN
jgi:hypothetical protein